MLKQFRSTAKGVPVRVVQTPFPSLSGAGFCRNNHQQTRTRTRREPHRRPGSLLTQGFRLSRRPGPSVASGRYPLRRLRLCCGGFSERVGRRADGDVGWGRARLGEIRQRTRTPTTGRPERLQARQGPSRVPVHTPARRLGRAEVITRSEITRSLRRDHVITAPGTRRRRRGGARAHAMRERHPLRRRDFHGW